MLNIKNKIEQIRPEIMKLYDMYEKVGIRVQEVPFDLGNCDHLSHIWVDGEDTGKELDGISCIDFSFIVIGSDYQNTYFGNYVAIVCGNNYIYGEDPGEIVIEDPVVEIIL